MPEITARRGVSIKIKGFKTVPTVLAATFKAAPLSPEDLTGSIVPLTSPATVVVPDFIFGNFHPEGLVVVVVLATEEGRTPFWICFKDLSKSSGFITMI